MNTTDLLNKLLPVVGAAIANAPAFADLYYEAVQTLHPADQATAIDALHAIQRSNDEGHAVTQAKLAEAAKH